MTELLAAADAARVAALLPSERDCCVYVESTLRRAYGDTRCNRAPRSQWRLYAGQSPWAPVEAAVRADLAVATGKGLPPCPGRWHVIQGWRGTPFAEGVSGHTFLWFAVTTDTGVRLDSTRTRGVHLEGLLPWAGELAGFRGGVAVAVLRPVETIAS